MAGKLSASLLLIRFLAFCSLFALAPYSAAGNFPFFSMGFDSQKAQGGDPPPTLVRVNIVSKYHGPKDAVEINGRLVTESPIIIQALSSTGIVLDLKGNVMTFLGYRWLDVQDHDLEIEVSGAGQKCKGKLVGIDQRNGVAVIRLMDGKLPKTPTCDECEVKGGTTVMAPVSPKLSQLRRAQIVSIGPVLRIRIRVAGLSR